MGDFYLFNITNQPSKRNLDTYALQWSPFQNGIKPSNQALIILCVYKFLHFIYNSIYLQLITLNKSKRKLIKLQNSIKTALSYTAFESVNSWNFNQSFSTFLKSFFPSLLVDSMTTLIQVVIKITKL